MAEEDIPASLTSIPWTSIVEQLSGHKVTKIWVEDPGSKPGDNWMSVLHSVTADLVESDTEKSSEFVDKVHYIFKCYPQHPGRQEYLNKTNMFYKELCYYSIWVKALRDFQLESLNIPENKLVRPWIPDFIGGSAINYTRERPIAGKIYLPLDNFIVLTDMKKSYDYEMVDGKDGWSYPYMELAVSELARNHALSWAYRQKMGWDLIAKFPFLKAGLDNEDKQMWENIVKQNVQLAAKTVEDALGPAGRHLSEATLQFAEKVGRVNQLFIDQSYSAEKSSWELHRAPPNEMVKASENETLWRVICHGDAWCNNFLFNHDERTGKPFLALALDFQLAREGCPMIDLAYLIYTGTTVDFRRKHLQRLLREYEDTFKICCGMLKSAVLPDLSEEEMQRRFHRAKVIGFMMAMTAFPALMLKESSTSSEVAAAAHLEQEDENTKMEDMFKKAFAEGAGSSSLYQTRIVELVEEMYDEGVI